MVVAALSSSVAHGEATLVRIRIEQPSSSHTRGDTRTETRSLKLFISNVSAEAGELKVSYLFIGRDVARSSQIPRIPGGICWISAELIREFGPPRGDLVVVAKGEQPATVKSGSAIIVETPAATAVSTSPKMVNGRLDKGKGTKFFGYAVRVYRGDKVVAETCEPREFAKWAFLQQSLSK